MARSVRWESAGSGGRRVRSWVMVWDEALADGYDVWSARMTDGLELESVYGDFTGRPLIDDSSEYVFIAYRNADKT